MTDTITTPKPCVDPDGTVGLCEHWGGEDGHDGLGRLRHGDSAKHVHAFVPGVYREGLCENGHDVELEQWAFDVMARTCRATEEVPA